MLKWVGWGWEYQSLRKNQIFTNPCQLGIFTYNTCFFQDFYVAFCQSAINFYL